MSDVSPEGIEVDRHVDELSPPSFNPVDLELVKRIGIALTGEGVRLGITELPRDENTPIGETKVGFDVSPEDTGIALGAIQTVFEYRNNNSSRLPEVLDRAISTQISIAAGAAGMEKKTRIAQAAHAAQTVKSVEQIEQAKRDGARKLAEGLAKLQKR